MIYFDHAATGMPKSEGVINAVASAMTYCGNPGRGIYETSAAGDRALYNCRTALSELFGTEPENCILTKNATEALNIAIKGFVEAQNKTIGVITSNYDHNAVARIIHSLQIKGKIQLYTFESDILDDEKTIENFKNAAVKDITLAVFTHASNVCGKIFPIKRLTEIARENNITVITDIAQTAGNMDIKAGEYGDILCLPGHKGLYGPAGTGAMIISKDFSLPILPLLHGGTGILSASRSMPDILPEKFEAGSINAPGYAGLYQAIRENKNKNIKLTQQIFKYLLNELKNMKKITVIGSPEKGEEDKWMPIILVNLWGYSSEEAAQMLANENIAVRGGLHCAPAAHKSLGTIKTGGVRISIGRGNTMIHAKALIDTLAGKITG